jgi:hypothetical protein
LHLWGNLRFCRGEGNAQRFAAAAFVDTTLDKHRVIRNATLEARSERAGKSKSMMTAKVELIEPAA